MSKRPEKRVAFAQVGHCSCGDCGDVHIMLMNNSMEREGELVLNSHAALAFAETIIRNALAAQMLARDKNPAPSPDAPHPQPDDPQQLH